jgi:hypothetical protein
MGILEAQIPWALTSQAAGCSARKIESVENFLERL